MRGMQHAGNNDTLYLIARLPVEDAEKLFTELLFIML